MLVLRYCTLGSRVSVLVSRSPGTNISDSHVGWLLIKVGPGIPATGNKGPINGLIAQRLSAVGDDPKNAT